MGGKHSLTVLLSFIKSDLVTHRQLVGGERAEAVWTWQLAERTLLRKMASSSRFRNSRSTFAKKTVDSALSYMFLIQKKSFNELYHLFCVKSLYLVFAQVSFPQAARCDAVNHHLFHVVPLKRYIRETLQNEEKKEIVHKKSIEFDVMTSICEFLHILSLLTTTHSVSSYYAVLLEVVRAELLHARRTVQYFFPTN